MQASLVPCPIFHHFLPAIDLGLDLLPAIHFLLVTQLLPTVPLMPTILLGIYLLPTLYLLLAIAVPKLLFLPA